MAEARRKPEERRPEEERRPPLREVKPGEEKIERPEEARKPISGLAIAGLALAAVSLVLPLIIAFVTGFTGAILGWVGLSQIRRGERSGSAVAWGAIVFGVLVGGLALVFLGQILTGTIGSSSGSMLNNIGAL